MGLFDIFKSSKERKTFGTLHGMDLREWNDGYKSDEKSIIKFVKKKLDSMSSKEFLNFLKKRKIYTLDLTNIISKRSTSPELYFLCSKKKELINKIR